MDDGSRECHPRHDQDPTKARVRVRYNMAAFSVSDRKRPGPDRRSQEISKISSEALEHVILTSLAERMDVWRGVLYRLERLRRNGFLYLPEDAHLVILRRPIAGG